LEKFRGGFLVTDGHHDRVLRVTRDGDVSLLMAFDTARTSARRRSGDHQGGTTGTHGRPAAGGRSSEDIVGVP